jgi:hypothetical protein
MLMVVEDDIVFVHVVRDDCAFRSNSLDACSRYMQDSVASEELPYIHAIVPDALLLE